MPVSHSSSLLIEALSCQETYTYLSQQLDAPKSYAYSSKPVTKRREVIHLAQKKALIRESKQLDKALTLNN